MRWPPARLAYAAAVAVRPQARIRSTQENRLTLQLHAFDTPNGRKITVALEEMGLPYELRIVDIGQGEQFGIRPTAPQEVGHA